MRQARIKPTNHDVWHHCYNRVVGTSEDRPFGDVEKEQFIRILFRIKRLYKVQVIGYQVLSNHYHILLQTPSKQPSEEETCARYKAFHNGRRTIEPGSAACQIWQKRLIDVSWFMRHLQQLFTNWYNQTRPIRRRGTLWASRFKNTVLEHGPAVYRCWSYVENNPVRAGIVKDAADYRFGSYGYWRQRGRHPFEQDVREALGDVQEAYAYLTGALEERGGTEESGFVLTTRRRVRFWVDGAVIGSERYVREIMQDRTNRHRLAKSTSEVEGNPLFAWRRLRTVPA